MKGNKGQIFPWIDKQDNLLSVVSTIKKIKVGS